MKRLYNIKLYILICIPFIFQNFEINAKDGKLYQNLTFDENLAVINRDIIIDFEEANNRIQMLEKRIDKEHDLDKLIVIQLKKIDLFSSFGDIPRVNYEINKTKKILNFHKTTIINKSWLKYFIAQSEGAAGKYNKMYSLLEKIPLTILQKDPHLNIYVNCAFARYYREKGKYQKMKTYLKDAEKIALANKNKPFLLFFITNTKGQMLFFNHEWNASLQCFESNKRLAKKNNWKFAEQYMNVCFSEIYLERPEQIDSAKYYYDLVLANKENTELRDLYYMYSGMEYYFHLKNERDSAYFYARKTNEIDDILEAKKSDDLVKELEKDYQFENTRYKLNVEIRKNNRLRNTLITFFLILISTLIVGYLFYRQKSKSNKLLKQQRDEIDEKNKQINLSLKEKENLLKEIHHRVKNNLQVITSLLNLQSKTITDKDALRVIEESKDRIYAISLIHNQLYLNNDFAYVEMKTYVPKLLDQIKRSMEDHSKSIHVNYTITDINLIIDEAVPIGLILCELISNSYKHAFIGIDQGEILVHFFKGDDGKLCLTYKDNGLGMSKNEEFLKMESTGAEIVSALIEQLDASYTYLQESEKGFGLEISFLSK